MADRYVDVDHGIENRRSVAAIVQNIANNLQDIVRGEIRLAKAEMTERGKQMSKAAGILAGGAGLLLVAALLLVVTVVAALSLVMPVWAAALLTGVVLAGAGGAMVFIGRQRLKASRLRPDATIESVREDVEWLKQQTR
jgi:uncharacterized membrane protein YqjE